MKQTRARRTLALAERTAQALERHQIRTAVIGAMALAIHGYPRATEDIDLATFAEPSALAKLARELKDAHVRCELALPDADDPLGGVLNVEEDGAELVQVVNFYNPMSRGSGTLAHEAILSADVPVSRVSRLRAVRLPHLVALKLYAGGSKSKGDVLELLARNPDADLVEVRAVCERHGLAPALEELLAARA